MPNAWVSELLALWSLVGSRKDEAEQRLVSHIGQAGLVAVVDKNVWGTTSGEDE